MGATEAEIDTARRAVELLQAHEELGALVSGRARFSVPYSLASDAGPIVYGRAAVVAERAGGLVVLGVSVGEPTEAARVELAIGAAAIARASGKSVEAVFAWAE